MLETETTQAILDLEGAHVLPTYPRPPFALTHGEGVYLYDAEGNAYLDLVAGIAVNALGYGDPALVEAISQQAAQLIHVSNLYHTAPHAELAAMLCEASFADKVFFSNSGAEANEAAIKFARKWAYIHRQPDPATPPPLYVRAHHIVDKTELVAFSGGFHGRTIGALSVTPRPKYQDPFRPLLPDVRIAPFNDLEAAQALIWPGTCAVIVEPVQGEGGIHPATPEFLQGLRTLCDQHGALLIFDEVQCGVGRTGALFAHEQFGVQPDILTLAKPLAGGLPIGATLLSAKIAGAIEYGDHGSTFGGGPVVTRAAQVVLDRVSDPAFLQHVQDVGMYFKAGLKGLSSPLITAVRGMGLMLGMDLSVPATEAVKAGYAHGLLMVNAGPNTLRFVPPLIFEKHHADEAIEKLALVLATL
ncbi:MAG: aspartate aminotransferase family protein [Anaerolineae bacterium]|nr:aspartate aminotransferase family protein [Anaerolineae bacterium]